MLEYLVIAAAIASTLAAFVYIRSMFVGRTKPNRVTWLMWAIAPLIAAAAALSNGVGWAVLPVFMAGFSPLMIFLASFFVKKAYWKPSRFDYFCGGLSALALVLWWLTKDPNVAIVFAIASDALASVPTIIKAWKNPETESIWPYVMGVFGAASGLVVAVIGNFSAFAFPSYLIITNSLVLVAIYKSQLIPFRRNEKPKLSWTDKDAKVSGLDCICMEDFGFALQAL
jgi:hypothetical protein